MVLIVALTLVLIYQFHYAFVQHLKVSHDNLENTPPQNHQLGHNDVNEPKNAAIKIHQTSQTIKQTFLLYNLLNFSNKSLNKQDIAVVFCRIIIAN